MVIMCDLYIYTSRGIHADRKYTDIRSILYMRTTHKRPYTVHIHAIRINKLTHLLWYNMHKHPVHMRSKQSRVFTQHSTTTEAPQYLPW